MLDIADLYKTEIAIPIAFEVTAESPEDVGSRTLQPVTTSTASRSKVVTESKSHRAATTRTSTPTPIREVTR